MNSNREVFDPENFDLDDSSTNEKSDSTGGLSKSTKNGDDIVPVKEEKLVFRARFLFLFVLLLAAAALGTVVYLISSSEEVGDFEDQVRTIS
jgi:hypothetical protein